MRAHTFPTSAALTVVLALTAAGTPAFAAPAAPSPDQGLFATTVDHLSPRLTDLSEEPLEHASVSRRAKALGLPASGPMSIPRGPDDSVRVEIVVDDTGGDAIEILRLQGAQFLHVSERYSTITANVPISDLRAVGSSAGVRSVTEVLSPQVGRSTPPASPAMSTRAGSCGVLVSDASIQHPAASSRRPRHLQR